VHTFEFVESCRIPEEKYAVASHRWNSGSELMLVDIKNGSRKDTSGYKKVVVRAAARLVGHHILVVCVSTGETEGIYTAT
jgi:hypothetical protein